MLSGFFKRNKNKPDASIDASKVHPASDVTPRHAPDSSAQSVPVPPKQTSEPVAPELSVSVQRPEPRQSQPAKPKPDWTPDQFAVPAQEGKTRFHDLSLDHRLLHAIADLGFQYCSEIQARSLPISLQGHDLIGKAQTGTGKTAAFLITIINDLINRPIPDSSRYSSEPRALILAPTRELAMQIEKDAKALTKYLDTKVYTVLGGIDYQKQKDHIRSNVIDILVATPGRLIDFLNSDDLFLDQIDFLVIDEADRMLDMGFIPDVKRILYRCPKVERRQTLMFSATFSDDVLNLSRRWTTHAMHIEIESPRQTTDAIEQHVFMVSSDEKLNIICRYIEVNQVKRAIIFGNRRDETRRLEAELTRRGISCALLSGEVPQAKRIRTLDQFKQGKIEILVATDVAGRGIHVEGVSHVFNYNLPEDPEDYVHRIGRTGRAGETGVSISFACEDDAFLLPEIEAYIGRKLECEYPHHLLDQKPERSKPEHMK